MAQDNPSFGSSKRFAAMETDESPGTIGFNRSKALTKKEAFLVLLFIVLLVICIAFIVLYAKEKDANAKDDEDSKRFTKNDDTDTGSLHSYGEVRFSPNKRTRNEKILAAVVIILLILLIIFLALFIHERSSERDCERKSSDHQGSSTEAPASTSTLPSTTSLPSTTPTTPPDHGKGPWEHVRLPQYFQPIHYDVRLVIDLKQLVFYGNVSVDVKLTNVTDYMYLHVNKLNISSPQLWKSGNSLPLSRHFWYEKNQFYVMEPTNKLEKGQYNISMDFRGKLDDDLKGLYRSTYRNRNGEEITIATTQMQPTDARKAFPCFDEPAFKATFSVVLVRHKDFISITNMPRLSYRNENNDMVADVYKETVVMSTYLLVFIVCDFTYIQDYAGKGNSSMKYYATKGQIDQAEFAKSIGGRILSHFENYFNISYPLPKADMIAIPDFAAGAMENWGLITYRETAMLYKKGQSSEGNKERIATVIAHELAHMWYGNLVTPEWWDDLWLNEGFASFVEYIGVNEVFPEWKMKDMFVIMDMYRAFSLDSLVTSHPILVPVNHPSEINEIFDSISYNKGASIIRMLQYFLGEDLFKIGLTNYLNKHSYGNARTKDLWAALTNASKAAGQNIDVALIMDTWTLQMGYPVVNVTVDGNTIVLTQQRFLSDHSANQSNTKYTSKYGYKWNIPFTIEVRQANTNKIINTTGTNTTWMKTGDVETKVSGLTWDPTTQWVKGNVGQTGFYRVNYPIENWNLLASQLEHDHEVLSISDRAGLIQDAFALADAKLLEYKYALNLTKYLGKEEDYVPWSAAYYSVSGLVGILPKSHKVYKSVLEYRFKKMRPTLDRLGFKDSGGHLEKYLRTNAIYAACSVKNETCLKFTKDRFDAWIKNDTKSPVPADLRSVVYFYGMSQSGAEEWDIAFQRLLKTNVASERRKLMYGLAGTPEPWLLNRYLQYSFDSSKIKSQDTSFVISYVANNNPIGRYFAWNFLKERWTDILDRYSEGLGFAMNRFISGVASSFSAQWELEELEKLFAKHPQTGSGTRARQQLLEKVRSNIQWRKDNEKDIENWLETVL